MVLSTLEKKNKFKYYIKETKKNIKKPKKGGMDSSVPTAETQAIQKELQTVTLQKEEIEKELNLMKEIFLPTANRRLRASDIYPWKIAQGRYVKDCISQYQKINILSILLGMKILLFIQNFLLTTNKLILLLVLLQKN